MSTADLTQLLALLRAPGAGLGRDPQLLRGLLAWPAWLVPISADAHGSFAPERLRAPDGRLAQPLYSSAQSMADAGWGGIASCELPGGEAFALPTAPVDAIVIDSGSDHALLLDSAQLAGMRKLLPALRVEQALVQLRWPDNPQADVNPLLDLLLDYPAYQLLLQDRQAILAPDDQQRRLLAVSVAPDATDALLSALPPLTTIAQRLIVTLSGRELFAGARDLSLDGLVFNCRGPSRAVAFAKGICDTVLARLPVATAVPANEAGTIPPEVREELVQGRKIAAIKVLRDLQPGLSLAEAKQQVEDWETALAAFSTQPASAVEPLPVDVLAALAQGAKIAAIKLLREARPALSLAEAKILVDAAEAALPTVRPSIAPAAAPATAAEPAPEAGLPPQVLAVLASHGKIAAIKLLRELSVLGLAEAKQRVDAAESQQPVAPVVALTLAAAPQLPPEVQMVLARDGKIAAIKTLLEIDPALGLFNAKQRVEAWMAAAPVAAPARLELPATVLEALRSGERLRALRELAQARSIALGEAEAQVDQRLREDVELRETYLGRCGLTELLRVSFQDGLQFPSGQIAPASYRCVVYCRTPSDWLLVGELPHSAQEALFEMLYGEGWRRGNSDGSRYVVGEVRCERLDATQRAARPWLHAENGPTERYWFARAMADGGIAKVDRAMF